MNDSHPIASSSTSTSPGAHPSPALSIKKGKSSSSSRKRQASSVNHSDAGEDDDDLDDEDGEESVRKKNKRSRISISCKECKRRKIKCDREMPVCGPCSKRRQPSGCTWDIFSGLTEAQDGALPASIARTTDLETAIARIAHIESFLKAALPPNLAVFTPLNSSTSGSGDRKSSEDQKRIGRDQGMPTTTATDEAFWEVENAALHLENGVFGASSSTSKLNGKPATPLARPAFTSASTSSLTLIPSSTSAGPIPAGSHRTAPSRFGAPSVELTTALTSIVATEKPPESLSRAHLSVDFDAPSEEVEQARQQELEQLLRALPQDRASVKHLVNLYFSSVAWLFHHLHTPTFLIELEAFLKMRDEGRVQEVDPCFLALLFMVLCVALDSTHASRSPLSLDPPKDKLPDLLASYSPERLKALPERWFAASQRALRLAEWETIPRIRSIQTIVLYTQYLQLCSPTRGQPSQLSVWLAAAIRLAQVMGLHLLGSNPEVMPPDDPAYPPGKCSIKRETAKRLWAVLVYQDWLGASAKSRCYLIAPSHFDTEDPLNVNDSDLSSIDWRINPAPDSVLTDSSSDRVRVAMARQVRKSFDAIVMSRTHSYDKVLEIDKGYKLILESLPDQWTLESSTTAGAANESPMLRFQRHFVIEGIHNRIFRLHRPFSTRGYTEPQFRPSTDACLKSARVVVVSTHNIADATRDIWYSYSHVMGAALVLFHDLFMSIDHDASDSEIDSKRQVLHLALEIFIKGSSEVTSQNLQAVVQQGAKIMNGLFRAEESRRTGRAAQALLAASGGGEVSMEGMQDDTPVESFADVLRRISRSLNTQSAPHRGTPPPTRNIPKKSMLSSSAVPAASAINPFGANGSPGLANSNLAQPVPTSFPFNSTTNMSVPGQLPLIAGGPSIFGSSMDDLASSIYDNSNPWPFETSLVGGEDDLSTQFLRELDLSSMMGISGTDGGMSGFSTIDVASAGGVAATTEGFAPSMWAPANPNSTNSSVQFGLQENGGGW